MKYNHKKTEKKWQTFWKKKKIFAAKDFSAKERMYILDMFPYPSGDGFHVGHVLGYTASDILAKYHSMRGKNVLHPMGWDAFGLPAENYAIKNKVHPSIAVKKNIGNFKKQLGELGLGYDWSREINTTDPAYYKWTQWIFLKLFERGLAYETDAPINWCPKDKTGLANEEVIDGKCERCGTPVEQKKLRQWVLKITAYADRLLEDLMLVDWPQKVKTMQENWIGRSEGAIIKFQILNSKFQISVFTTRPDTLFGATFMVISPEHPLIRNNELGIKNYEEIKKYIETSRQKTELERISDTKEKTGVELRGIKAINPANKEEIPIFVADYVLMGYGTGAIMAVPAHDERDSEFASKFNLPIKEVIIPNRIDIKNPPIASKRQVERKNVQAIVRNPATGKFLCLKSLKFNWVTFPMGGIERDEEVVTAAKREVEEETGYKNLKLVRILGGEVRAEYFAAHKDENRVSFTRAVLFDLVNEERTSVNKDWESEHEILWVDESKLNYDFMVHAEMNDWVERIKENYKTYAGYGVLVNSGAFTGLTSEKVKEEITKFARGTKKINYKLRDWIFSRQRYWGEPIPIIKCKNCGNVPVPEKDLPVKLPNVKSYEPTGTGESPLANIASWVNVKCPKCKSPAKRETNTMPQWAGSCWYYLRYLDPKNKKSLTDTKKEKYWMSPKNTSPSGGVDLYIGGVEHAVLHLLYARFWHKVLYDIGIVSTKEPFYKLVNQGTILGSDNQKMSKSRGNAVPAKSVIETHGADVLRTYEMFMGPLEDAKPWDDKGIIGVKRFFDRVYTLVETTLDKKGKEKEAKEITQKLHKTIKKVTEDIEHFRFNTAISALMILLNEVEKQPTLSVASRRLFIQLLVPFAPHFGEELWSMLGNKKSVFLSPWPSYDSVLIKEESITLIIQINGKMRDQFEVKIDKSEEEVKQAVLAREATQKWVAGKEIKKIIYVKNKLVNIVI